MTLLRAYERSPGMPSTVIRRWDYLPDRRELVIEFTTGRRYCYREVPEDAAKAFRNAFAKGVHFNTHIRRRYDCRRLDDVDQD